MKHSDILNVEQWWQWCGLGTAMGFSRLGSAISGGGERGWLDCDSEGARRFVLEVEVVTYYY